MKIERRINDILSDIFGLDKFCQVEEQDYLETSIGNLIACGTFSAVIDIDFFYTPHDVKERFKYPVLILSIEKEKPKLMKSILEEEIYIPDLEEEREKSLKEWYSDLGYSSQEEAEDNGYEFDWLTYAEDSIYPFLEYISSNHCVNVFFMEKLNNNIDIPIPVIDFVIKAVENALPCLEAHGSYFVNCNLDTSSLDEAIEDHEEEFIIPDDRKRLMYELYEIIFRDLEKAATVLYNKNLYLDLHCEQFIKSEKGIHCIDPFMIF